MRQIAGASLLFLAACTAAPAPQKPPAEPAVQAKSVTAVPIEAPPRETPAPKPNPKQQAAADPPARRAKINDDPQQLLRLDGHRVAELLGPASFVRRDGPAEVWQYRAKVCVLDVYLYKEPSGLTVAHVDLRQRRNAPQPARRCFHDMLTGVN